MSFISNPYIKSGWSFIPAAVTVNKSQEIKIPWNVKIIIGKK